MLLKYCYFEMWPDHIWFMWSWGRLCLFWPITDGLACSMFLFPQCHSHNPSPTAEPQACTYNMLCVCKSADARMGVCSCGYTVMWRWRAFVQLCMHAHVICNFLSLWVSICSWWCVGTFACALSLIMLQEIVSSRLVRVSCDWRSIQIRILSSHFIWCVLPAMEWIRGWAKQTTFSPGGLL